MPRIHTVSTCDEDELVRRLRPRDDVLVREQVVHSEPGRTELEGVEGPFRHYRRTVSWSSQGPDRQLTQDIDYRLAIPYWAWLYSLPVRRTLPAGLPGGRRPWWSTPDRLSPGQSTMVAAVTLFNLVGGLLYGLLTQVLTFVAADLGDGSRSQQTTLLAVVRIGIVVTIVVMALADRVGRRRMALIAFVGSAVLTLLTALAPGLWAVGALQFVSRNLAIAGLLCVDTIAVEELPPGSRAMVAGLGTLSYGLGAGIIVMTLPLADLGAGGWRLTFVVAGLSLPVIWHAARHLPESGRFTRLAAERSAVEHRATEHGAAEHGGETATAAALTLRTGRVDRWRFILVGAIFFLLNVFLAPSSQLQNDYLRTEVGFSGLLITVFVLATSTPGGLGVLAGGRIADTRGRKWAIVPGLLAIGIFNAIFFSSVGVPMWVASLCGSLIGGLAAPALGVIAPELFPTARRGTVRGVVAAIAVGGSVVGLLTSGWLIDARGYATAFTLLAVAPIAGALVALAIPETRGRELEDINPEPSSGLQREP
jgi:MFS family permease